MKTVMRAAVGAASLLGLGIVHPASAGDQLALATDEAGAPAYTAGLALASLIKVELQPAYKIDVEVINSSGPVENIRMMQEGAADLAILPSVTGHAARAAIGSFAGDEPEHGLRAVTTLWYDVLHLLVRDDDAPTGTIEDLLLLKEQTVFFGREATGSMEANRLLLTGLGVDVAGTFEIAPAPDGDLIAAISQGRLDALSIATRPPSAMFQAVGKTPASGLKFLNITTEQMTRLNGSHWLWAPYTIHAATYPGQDEDISTVAHANLLAVRADIPEETVYLITKSIFENLAYLHRVDPLLAGLALDRALPGMSLPLHPGALRYFKEAGLIPDVVFQEPTLNGGQPYQQDGTGYPGANVAKDTTSEADDPMLLATPPGSGADTPEGSTPLGVGNGTPSKPERQSWRHRAIL